MGIMEKLRAELVDIVEWVDDNHHAIVWRFPRFHNQIKNGAQLIVRPGQCAIMVSNGKVADVFQPGMYRLETKNLPVLSTLLGWKYGFDSPFKAEVYFVNTTVITDLKWGTPNPVIMRDVDFGPVRVRGFGTYTLRALDPKTLLEELVGTDSVFEADEVSELLRSIVNNAFADVVASSNIPVLDLARNYRLLSELVRNKVAEMVDDEYGLQIPQLIIVNISLPAEVENALDARTGMAAVGNLAAYQAYQIGTSMPVAAANPAGGLAGAGLGLGMGMAIAQPMMHGMQSPYGGPTSGGGLPTPPPAQAPTPPPPMPSWHLAENGEAVGPFTPPQLAEAAATGRLRSDTLVWRAGMDGWTQAGEVPELAGLFRG
jgi:membrane protease subunit (stomatin/prohibitin family)